jgi:superfamily II DNA or RNA helicase
MARWSDAQRGVVRVVTGGGKTVFAEMCMLNFRARHPSGRIVIIVPTVALLDQWVVSLSEELQVPDFDVGLFSGQERSAQPKAVNVCVVNTARDIAPSLSRPGPTLLIVDECHRLGSAANARALEGEYAATLGLSATPEREYDTGFAQHITPALGEIIYAYDFVQASRDGVITPFDIVNVRINLLPDEQVRYDAFTERAVREHRKLERADGSPEVLRRILQQRAAVSASATMRIPVAARILEEHRGQRTLVFHERVDAAESILAILRSRKHSSTIYHSRIGPYLRRDNLKLYRRGVFDVLVSCRALDEGMNVPETAIAVVASATASRRQRIQRLGRVLRPARGKKAAIVYTIYATAQEQARLEEEERTLSGVACVRWLQSGKSDGPDTDKR